MGDARGLNHPDAFQFNWLNAKLLEQSDTRAEQDGHQGDMDFVQQSSLEALLGDARGRYGDILLPAACFA